MAIFLGNPPENVATFIKTDKASNNPFAIKGGKWTATFINAWTNETCTLGSLSYKGSQTTGQLWGNEGVSSSHLTYGTYTYKDEFMEEIYGKAKKWVGKRLDFIYNQYVGDESSTQYSLQLYEFEGIDGTGEEKTFTVPKTLTKIWFDMSKHESQEEEKTVQITFTWSAS